MQVFIYEKKEGDLCYGVKCTLDLDRIPTIQEKILLPSTEISGAMVVYEVIDVLFKAGTNTEVRVKKLKHLIEDQL